MDGGSANFAGAKICPSIPGDKKAGRVPGGVYRGIGGKTV